MMGPWMMGGFGGLMMIPMFLLWGLIVWGIVALARGVSTTGSSGHSNQTDSALEILKRRYARGEVNKQEYEERKNELI